MPVPATKFLVYDTVHRRNKTAASGSSYGTSFKNSTRSEHFFPHQGIACLASSNENNHPLGPKHLGGRPPLWGLRSEAREAEKHVVENPGCEL